MFFSLGRHSRYIRWRRSTDTESPKSRSKSKSKPLPSSKLDMVMNSTGLLYADDRTRIRIVREKLSQLLERFTELFNLFEDEQEYTQDYLDEVDDLMYV